MRSQLEKLESDLEQSKATREKLREEFDRQIEEVKERNADEVIASRDPIFDFHLGNVMCFIPLNHKPLLKVRPLNFQKSNFPLFLSADHLQ